MPTRPKYHRPKRKRVFTRQPAHTRGYDYQWGKLRLRHLKQHPLCVHCLTNGFTTAAREVDHIVPFNGVDDPLRLDEGNLQSLCRRCHAVKTNRGG